MNKKPTIHFFETAAAMRAWLEQHHSTATELHVGFYKRRAVSDARPSITGPESVAEALCFGWIDGLLTPIDADRYSKRFTPRRPGSKWSAFNIKTIAELEAAQKMTDAGRNVFAARKDAESPGYKTEKKIGALDETRARAFRNNGPAWTFFETQPPGYQRAAAWWVMHAKREETRDRRLATLIECSAAGKRVL